jgi:hypothetical protein
VRLPGSSADLWSRAIAAESEVAADHDRMLAAVLAATGRAAGPRGDGRGGSPTAS